MNSIPVNVTLRGVHPHEELVYYIRRSCAVADRQLGASRGRGAWAVTVERQLSAVGPRYVVHAAVARTDDGSAVRASQSDPDMFLAVRNAFSVLVGQVGRPPAPAKAVAG